jgi:acrylyl-CoA reductase (NADPH)
MKFNLTVRTFHDVTPLEAYPIVPGIDLAGVVEASNSALFTEGDSVVLTGNKCGQFVDGGYAEKCRVQGEWLVRCSFEQG